MSNPAKKIFPEAQIPKRERGAVARIARFIRAGLQPAAPAKTRAAAGHGEDTNKLPPAA